MNPVVTSSICSFSNPRSADGSVPSTQNASFQFASSTCIFTASTSTATGTVQTVKLATSTGATSTQFGLVPTVTGGDLVIIALLTLLLFQFLTTWIIYSFRSIRTKKRYMQYNGGDVEVRDDL